MLLVSMQVLLENKTVITWPVYCGDVVSFPLSSQADLLDLDQEDEQLSRVTWVNGRLENIHL